MSNSNRVSRRAMLAAAATGLLATSVSAQTAWPNRPIKLIVPFVAGGGTDPLARAIGAKLSSRLGQPVVIENKGGAGGTLGTDAVAKSLPDGHTLLLASTSITTNAASGKKLPYDLAKDLEPIGQIGSSPLLVIASSDSKFMSVRDVLDLARTRPQGVSYGSGGIGAISHLGMELLARDAKAKFMHVPYKGMAAAFTDLIGGHLQMALVSPASATQFAGSGKMRILAVTTAQRSPFMPNVPTVAEAVPGFQLDFWWGLLGPAGMPPAVVKRLSEELNWALAQPEVRDLLARESASPTPGKPEDLAKLISFETARWAKLVKDANIKME